MAGAPAMYVFKIVLIGDGAVGKSTLRKRFMGKTFDATYIMTVGADFAAKIMEVDGETVKFVIWDLAGQPHFREVRASFYKGARGALVVYDIARRKTYENVLSWVNEFLKNVERRDVAVVLVGNKVDLRGEGGSMISEEEGLRLRDAIEEKFGIPVSFIETSAKTGENVEEAFCTLARELLKKAKERSRIP